MHLYVQSVDVVELKRLSVWQLLVQTELADMYVYQLSLAIICTTFRLQLNLQHT